MAQHITKLAVLFADICGSTALYDNLGDDQARQLIAQCLNLLSNEVNKHRGILVKTIGDEIMCTFVNADVALQAASAMQQAVKDSRSSGQYPMHVRIGFHYGDVIIDTGDVFGDTVNVASRVSAITRASQIMTTQAVFDALSPVFREKTRQVMRADFKGKSEPFDIYLVVWETDDVMSTRVGMPAFRKLPEQIDELTLTYRGATIKVNKQRRSVIMGRGDTCDLTVQSTFASRQHLRVEYRSGKFFLVDQSTNGTYIRSKDGDISYCSRDEVVIQGEGSISLGHTYSDNPQELVEFKITSIQDNAHEEMKMKTMIFNVPPVAKS